MSSGTRCRGGTIGVQGSGRQSWRFVMERQKGFENSFGASLSRAPVLFHCNENEAKTLSLAEQNGLSRVHSGPGGASCDLNRAQARCSLTPASSVLAFLSSSADRGSGWSALVLVRVPFCVRHQHHSVEAHLCTKAYVRIRPPRPSLLSLAGSFDATVPEPGRQAPHFAFWGLARLCLASSQKFRARPRGSEAKPGLISPGRLPAELAEPAPFLPQHCLDLVPHVVVVPAPARHFGRTHRDPATCRCWDRRPKPGERAKRDVRRSRPFVPFYRTRRARRTSVAPRQGALQTGVRGPASVC